MFRPLSVILCFLLLTASYAGNIEVKILNSASEQKELNTFTSNYAFCFTFQKPLATTSNIPVLNHNSTRYESSLDKAGVLNQRFQSVSVCVN